MKFLVLIAAFVALCSARPTVNDCLYPEHGAIIPAPAPLPVAPLPAPQPIYTKPLPAPAYPLPTPALYSPSFPIPSFPVPAPALPAPAPIVPAPAPVFPAPAPAVAAPAPVLPAPVPYIPSPEPCEPTHTQYHAQDTFGQYQFGYNTPTSSRHEIHGLDGSSHGSYSYYDSNGVLQTVNYEAGPAGFQVAATNLPVAPSAQPAVDLAPVSETPEVANARAEHLAEHERIAAGIYPEGPKAPEPPAVPELKPVEDEPAVAAAKAEHLALVKKVEAGDVQLPVPSAPIDLPQPEPVTDEPAVAKAKAEHLAIHKTVTDYENWQKSVLYAGGFVAPAAPVAPVAPLPAPVAPIAIAHPPVISHEIKSVEVKPIVQHLPLAQPLWPQPIQYAAPHFPC